ncbi:MAG: histidine kinase [Bacteroidetes bacterium]|nr:histidine kinase [Bacteroidota bacterium]
MIIHHLHFQTPATHDWWHALSSSTSTHASTYFTIKSVIVFIYHWYIGEFVCTGQQNLKHIESERDKTALVYLKSQMNPHFIFNTFNSIYGLAVKEKADKTANGMLKLSDMLRYVLTDTQSDFVRLNKEINYINNYIELQKLRIESDTIIQYQITGNQNLHVIAPMLLIPFIENAFKYGINPGKESNIDIQIKIEDASLLLQVKNKIIVHNSSSEKMGIGIENTRNRLELLYPHKYILTLHETPTDYEVYLKIILT